MTADATYIMAGGPAAARILQRAGRWDQALAALPTQAPVERAEILVDRCFWQLKGAAEAEEAVEALRPDAPILAGFLDAQVRYTRLLFDLDPRPDDLQRARVGFTAATADAQLAGWAGFWLGVLTDNIDGDPAAAAPAFEQALARGREEGDALLESYAARHVGAPLLEHDRQQNREQGIAYLRWSYHLRASLGARPQTAAAALTLAEALPVGTESDQLRQAVQRTARDLELTWLLSATTT